MVPKPKRTYYTSAIIKKDPERNVRYFNLYVVVGHEGNLKKAGYRVAVYKSYKRACMGAKEEGDSVIEVEVNLSREPMYINKKAV